MFPYLANILETLVGSCVGTILTLGVHKGRLEGCIDGYTSGFSRLHMYLGSFLNQQTWTTYFVPFRNYSYLGRYQITYTEWFTGHWNVFFLSLSRNMTYCSLFPDVAQLGLDVAQPYKSTYIFRHRVRWCLTLPTCLYQRPVISLELIANVQCRVCFQATSSLSLSVL